MIECLVFFSNAVTLLILMIKSRCIKVGVDQAEQFDPENLSQMINRIFDFIDLDLLQKKRTRSRIKAKWVNRVKKVKVDKLIIVLRLTE